jgi:hypothetical protein
MKLVLALVVLMSPCRADAPPEDAGRFDAAHDTGVADAANDTSDAATTCGEDWSRWYIQSATPSPDGLGWCCPRTATPSCDCGREGAFVTDPCGCAAHVECVYDARPSAFDGYTDEHGCERWHIGYESCTDDFDAGVDAGTDAGTDSGIDSGVEG